MFINIFFPFNSNLFKMVLQIDTCMQACQPGLTEKCQAFIEKSVILKQKV